MIRVAVDPTNPGQFFACCGLLELADRLWPGAEGWFEDGEFRVSCEEGTLIQLLEKLVSAPLTLVDAADIYSSAGQIGPPFDLLLDWWHDKQTGGASLKPWAGTMESIGIALAMREMFKRPECQTRDLFDYGTVVPSPSDPKKKKEPYYFDARRKENAHPRDIGFSPNEYGMTTIAHPAVEFLSLIGLQRCRPIPTGIPRVAEYYTWSISCPASILAAAVCGLIFDPQRKGFRFENAFRTGQRKHKAFAPAIPISRGSDE